RVRGKRANHRVPNQMGEADLATATAREMVVDDDPVVRDQFRRDGAHARRGRHREGSVHVLDDLRGHATDRTGLTTRCLTTRWFGGCGSLGGWGGLDGGGGLGRRGLRGRLHGGGGRLRRGGYRGGRRGLGGRGAVGHRRGCTAVRLCRAVRCRLV